MAISIRRRELVLALGGVAAAWPLAAQAQQAAKPLQVGFLYPGPQTAAVPRMAAYLSGLQAGGFRAEQFTLVPRVTGGNSALLAPMAAELVTANVNLIAATGPAAARAAQTATSAIPIVVNDLESDPVGSGLVASVALTGGNITAVIEGGARVIGVDAVFPNSIEQSEIPFGKDTLGARMRGFDRDFLIGLRAAARAGKLVLGQIQLREEAILPHWWQLSAVGGRDNVRALNVQQDADEVVRRVPLTFLVDGKPVPGLAVELAARALGVAPEIAPDGTMTLAGYRIPSAVSNTLTLNFPRRRRDPELLARRSARLPRAREQGVLPAQFQRQGRDLRRRARVRGPKDDFETISHRAGETDGRTVRAASSADDGLHFAYHPRSAYPCSSGEQSHSP
jgi:CHASE2 domain/ABC transporter substrate binding protein